MNNENQINKYVLIGLIFINFILESTLFQSMKIFGVSPNMTLVLVIIITITYGLKKGLIVSVLSGMLLDSFFGLCLGVNLFSLVLTALIISYVGEPLFTGNRLNIVYLTAMSVFVFDIVSYLFMTILGRGVAFVLLSKNLPIEIIYNSLFSILLYKTFNWYIEKGKIEL